MFVQKPPNRVFVETTDRQAAPRHPTGKVGDATEVGNDRLGRVATFRKVPRKRINVRRQRAIGEQALD